MTPSTKVLPESMLTKMSKADREKLGKGGMTKAEAEAAYVAKNEKELQQQIAGLLRRNGIWFDQDATHKRRTGTRGTPDFLFAVNGYPVAWEVKFAKGRLDPDQIEAAKAMLGCGWKWTVIRSLSDAIEHLRTVFAWDSREGE